MAKKHGWFSTSQQTDPGDGEAAWPEMGTMEHRGQPRR